ASSSTNEPSPTTDEMPSVPPAPGLRLDAGRPLSEISTVEATTSAPDSSSDLATSSSDVADAHVADAHVADAHVAATAATASDAGPSSHTERDAGSAESTSAPPTCQVSGTCEPGEACANDEECASQTCHDGQCADSETSCD